MSQKECRCSEEDRNPQPCRESNLSSSSRSQPYCECATTGLHVVWYTNSLVVVPYLRCFTDSVRAHPNSVLVSHMMTQEQRRPDVLLAFKNVFRPRKYSIERISNKSITFAVLF